MTGRLIGAIFGVLLAGVPSPSSAFQTGHDLLAFATERHEIMLYIAGIMEGHMLTAAMLRAPKVACPKPETTRKELAVAVLLWMRENPERLSMSARSMVLAALVSKFPCK